MTQNQSAGNGALFKKDKQGVESRPDYTGTAKIYNKDFFISAWVKTSQTGKRYLSLSFREKDAASASQGQTSAETSTQAQENSSPADDEIPF